VSATFFFASAVCAGFVLIGVVAHATLRPQPQQRPSVTALLGLLGFALVASPNWTSISIRGEGLELSLLREMQARQLQALTELRAGTCPEPAPEAGAAPAAAPPGPAGDGKPAPGLAQPPKPGPTAARAADPGPALPLERAQRLVDAFERGEIELRFLSNRELLALNERLSERVRASLPR